VEMSAAASQLRPLELPRHANADGVITVAGVGEGHADGDGLSVFSLAHRSPGLRGRSSHSPHSWSVSAPMTWARVSHGGICPPRWTGRVETVQGLRFREVVIRPDKANGSCDTASRKKRPDSP